VTRRRIPLWLIGVVAAVALVTVLAVRSWQSAVATEERLFDYSDALVPADAAITGEWSYHCVSGDAFSWLNRHRAKTCRALWLDVEDSDAQRALAEVKRLALKAGRVEYVQAGGAFVVKRGDYTATVGLQRPDLREDCTPIPELNQYCGDIVINTTGPKTGLLP
jgi:hypothetical protein